MKSCPRLITKSNMADIYWLFIRDDCRWLKSTLRGLSNADWSMMIKMRRHIDTLTQGWFSDVCKIRYLLWRTFIGLKTDLCLIKCSDFSLKPLDLSASSKQCREKKHFFVNIDGTKRIFRKIYRSWPQCSRMFSPSCKRTNS